MFNILKKNNSNIDILENTSTIIQDTKSNNEVVQEIHDSYDKAHEDILSWANNIIAQANTEDINKGERLAKLGFINTIKAKFSEKEIKLKKEAKEKADLINYYNIHYPFNKFITREQVAQINKKYNLVCVTADCYLMDIPEKNLQEIENFKIKNNKDLVFEGVLDDWKYKETFNFLTKDECKEKKLIRIKEESLYISCPKSEVKINTGYSIREDGFALKDKEVKDPIVLKPVVGGFLIVTKWGLEASDELVINQNLN